MRWPRLRFTLGRLMIAAAIIPIVLAAGRWAGNRWPTVVGHVFDEVGLLSGRSDAVDPVAYDLTEFSPWSALVAMAATTALLAALWILLDARFRRK